MFEAGETAATRGCCRILAIALAVGSVAAFTMCPFQSIAYAQGAATFGPTASPPGASAYFVDLKDGATIGTKTVVHFGLRGMGVAPAGSDRPNTGHHHLLIDTDVPKLDKPIPNDFNHLHFGAGQTEAEITLTPGKHTLQLLLADKGHVPHNPPVMSNKISVTVVDAPAPETAANSKERKRSPPGAKVYLVYPYNGAVVTPVTTVRFGLVGMGVAPAGVEKTNTGHHHLLIDAELPPFDKPIPSDFNHLHFGAGQTEASVTLSMGRHKLQLLLADEKHIPHDPPIFSQPITVFVTPTGRLPQPAVARPVYRPRVVYPPAQPQRVYPRYTPPRVATPRPPYPYPQVPARPPGR